MGRASGWPGLAAEAVRGLGRALRRRASVLRYPMIITGMLLLVGVVALVVVMIGQA